MPRVFEAVDQNGILIAFMSVAQAQAACTGQLDGKVEGEWKDSPSPGAHLTVAVQQALAAEEKIAAVHAAHAAKAEPPVAKPQVRKKTRRKKKAAKKAGRKKK